VVWVLKGIKQKNVKKETGTLAGSFSCTRVFLAGCSPAEPASASSGVTKLSIIEKNKNDF